MALAAHQAGHFGACPFSNSSPHFLSNRSRANVKINLQPGRTKCSGRGWSVGCRGASRDYFERRGFHRSPSFEEVPLLKRHSPGGALSGAKFGCSGAQAFRKLPRPSDGLSSTLNCLAQWQRFGILGLNSLARVNCLAQWQGVGVLSLHSRASIKWLVQWRGLGILCLHGRSPVNCLTQWQGSGILGVHSRASQRARGTKGDDGGNASDEEGKDGEGEGDGKGEGKVEELKQEGEEAGGAGNNESKQKGEGRKGDGKDSSSPSVKKEDFKTRLWKKIRGPGPNLEENPLGPEEEMMLQDLESLRFEWKGLLDPTWENALALAFTALLTVALIKILSQLVIVVMTILVAALKYTVLAAFLLGILIFLL